MQRRRLGASRLEITPIGLGTWALGGSEWGLGWGAQDDAESTATIRRAVELGINWIDTAAVYGLGHAETVVARALEGLPTTERPFVFTKCGLPWDEAGRVRHSLEPASIRREIEGSLRRLRVETIDLYQIHWPIYPPDRPAPDIERAWTTLNALMEEGKTRYLGVSNFDAGHLQRLSPSEALCSLQSPYSLLRRKIEEAILPYAASEGIGVLVYSPLQSGLLSGKMTRERIEALPEDDWRKTKSMDFKEPLLTHHLSRVERLRRVARRLRTSPAELAVAWTLRRRAVSGTIVGARRPRQIEELVGAATLTLGDDDTRELEG